MDEILGIRNMHFGKILDYVRGTWLELAQQNKSSTTNGRYTDIGGVRETFVAT
jgi:hypothetical protein